MKNENLKRRGIKNEKEKTFYLHSKTARFRLTENNHTHIQTHITRSKLPVCL